MTSFEDFQSTICEMLGIPACTLSDEPEGQREFGIVVGDTPVRFTESSLGEVACIVMSTTFSAPPPDKESEVLRSLMHANFELAGAGAPVFARDPESGDIHMYHTLLLSQVDLAGLRACMDAAAEAAADWQETYFTSMPRRALPRDARADLHSLA